MPTVAGTTEELDGLFYDFGAWAKNVRHSNIGADGGGLVSDAAVFAGLEAGHYEVGPGTYLIDSNTTTPSTAALEVSRGAVFSVASGVTLTIAGPLSAGCYPIFTGAGSVVLGAGKEGKVYPEWWGVDGTDDHVQLQQAWNAAKAAALEVAVGRGSIHTYLMAMPAAVTRSATTISFDATTRTITDSGGGLAPFAGASTVVITGSGANNKTVKVLSVSATQIVLPSGETLTTEAAGGSVTLTGWKPALDLSADSTEKAMQPRIVGQGRTTLSIAFPAEAPAEHDVIHLHKGALGDNARGFGLKNIRLRNSAQPLAVTAGVDFRGTGLRARYIWNATFLEDCEISGFRRNVDADHCYATDLTKAELRDSNFGLVMAGTPNGSHWQAHIDRIYPCATLPAGYTLTDFPPDVAATLGYRVGAGVYTSGSLTGANFKISLEIVYAPGWYFGSGPSGCDIWTRIESCSAPIWCPGPISPAFNDSVRIFAIIDCDILCVPAVYLKRARGWTGVLYFYQRNSSVTTVLQTVFAQGCRFRLIDQASPTDSSTLRTSVIDGGTNNTFDFGDHTPGFPVGGWFTTLAANQVATAVPREATPASGAFANAWPSTGLGSCRGIAVQLSAAIVSGQAIFTVYKNGVSTGKSITLSSGVGLGHTAHFGHGEIPRTDEDKFTVVYDTGSGFQTVGTWASITLLFD